MSQTQFQKFDDNSTDSQEIEAPAVKDRIEGLVSLGRPHCKVCWDLHRDERPKSAAFHPDRPITYVRDHGQTLYDWMGTTVCEHHDRPAHRPDDATHRVVDAPEYVGDQPDRDNSDVLHNVLSVEVLE